MPYPQLSAQELSGSEMGHVTANNRAVNGYTTDDVLKQLTTDQQTIDEVRSADAVELEIGANDVPYSRRCATDAACYAPKTEQMRHNLDAILRRLRQLTATPSVPVILLDYWSVWLGGQYAQEQGQAYVEAAATVTADVDAAIRAIAAQTRSTYVDLRAAFKGPDYSYDETHYLASDGDHPNAAGHTRIASAIAAVVRTG